VGGDDDNEGGETERLRWSEEGGEKGELEEVRGVDPLLVFDLLFPVTH